MLELESAGPFGELPLITKRNPPGDIFERQIEFRGQQLQVKGMPVRGAYLATVKYFYRNRLAFARLRLERQKDPVLFAPRPDDGLVHKGEPELRVLRQGQI